MSNDRTLLNAIMYHIYNIDLGKIDNSYKKIVATTTTLHDR